MSARPGVPVCLAGDLHNSAGFVVTGGCDAAEKGEWVVSQDYLGSDVRICVFSAVHVINPV
jgi:hypothetical protein